MTEKKKNVCLPKRLIASRKLIVNLAKNDFKKKCAGSYFGVVWAVIQPVITVLLYWFVFEFGLHQKVNDLRTGIEVPFVLWLMGCLVPTVSSIINGGHRITPHFGVKITGEGGKEVETLRYETKNDICTKETSETMRYLLERVVSDGSGKNAKIEGLSIGGKTATSQTLPRSDHKYISSFLGFAPADDPKVLVLVVINDPKGTYYGGQIAAPVAKEIMENILPYLAK